jgi:hypothetical protein
VIDNLPKVLNLKRLFPKLNWPICNKQSDLPFVDPGVGYRQFSAAPTSEKNNHWLAICQQKQRIIFISTLALSPTHAHSWRRSNYRHGWQQTTCSNELVYFVVLKELLQRTHSCLELCGLLT